MTARVTVYVTDSGKYLTRWQLRRRFERGEWHRRLVDESTETILVESPGGTVTALSSLAIQSLPPYLEVRSDGRRTWVADRRRTVPDTKTVVLAETGDVKGPHRVSLVAR